MIILGIVNFLKTVLILIGIFALLRFWGKLVLIKKAKQSERKNHRNTYSEAESKEANKRVGKTTLHLFNKKNIEMH